MTDTLVKTILLNPDGDLTIPKEFLGNLEPGTAFRLERNGTVLKLEVARKLYEIEDPEERVEAFDAFVKRFAQKTGVSWPEDYNVRDSLYV